MIAIATILVKKRAGSLSAVALGLSTKGYQLQSQEITEAEFSLQRIRLFLKCTDKNAEQVEKDIQSLGPDIRIEKVELEGTSNPTVNSVKTEKEVLQDIVRAFPDVSEIVRKYGQSLSAETRSKNLFNLGHKIGRATYKRDFALGSPLKMPAAWRRMIVPAVRKFGETKADDESVTLLDCPFCLSDPTSASCCEFVTGFIQGLLDAAPYTKGTKVHEAGCKSKGAQGCSFIIDK